MQTPLTPLQPIGTYLSDKPEAKMLTMSREKFDAVIQKAMGRAAKPAKAESALLRKRIALAQEELELTRQLTQLYLNQ